MLKGETLPCNAARELIDEPVDLFFYEWVGNLNAGIRHCVFDNLIGKLMSPALDRARLEACKNLCTKFIYALHVGDLFRKIVVERRRALPFARFRAKLVAVLLVLTLVPALLVLVVGSELILTSVDRWFNAPMDEILAAVRRDKKGVNGRLHFVLATRLGATVTADDVSEDELRGVLGRMGLR